MSFNLELIEELAIKALNSRRSINDDIKQLCWAAIHEHVHGFKPLEYDIREIDEGLYIEVIDYAMKLNQNEPRIIL